MVNFTVKQVNLEKAYPASRGWWIARWNGAISDEWGWVGPGMAQMDAHFFNRAEEGVLGIYIASLSNGTEAEPPNLSFQLTIKDGQVVTVDFETGRIVGGGPGQTVQLAPGESKVVSFETTPQEARTYQVSVDGLTGSFVARPAIPEWVVAVSDNSPPDWSQNTNHLPPLARDGNFNSYAVAWVPQLSWSNFLELTFASAILATKYRYKGIYHYDGVNVIDIDAYYNGAWQHVYQGPFANEITEVKSLGGTYSVTKLRTRYYNSSPTWEDGGYLFELQLGTGALVAQPDFYMPTAMDVVVTDGSILNQYWSCRFSVVITNRESVVGTHIINWWDNAGVIAGSQEITLNLGETYTWQLSQWVDFRQLAAPYTMQLSGDWVTNNLSKGDARP